MSAEQLITQVTQTQARSFHNPKAYANKGGKQVGKTVPKPPVLTINNNKTSNNVDEFSSRDKYGLNSPRQTDVSDKNDETTQNEEEQTTPPTVDKEESQVTVSVHTSSSSSSSTSPDVASSKPRPQETAPKLTAPWRPDHLLPPVYDHKKGKKCLILDLDETLVHSSFQPVECDFKIPVDIEGIVRTIYVSKRPHVDEFMKACGDLFEIVVFTASLAKYADPLLDLLDIHGVIDHRLFRESCTPHCGTYVKDLFRMGRALSQIIIIDNSPHSYAFNPHNAIPCESWFEDKTDQELLDLLVILHRVADPSVTDVIAELEALEVSGVSLIQPQISPSMMGGAGMRGHESVSESGSEDEVTASGESESEGGEDESATGSGGEGTPQKRKPK